VYVGSRKLQLNEKAIEYKMFWVKQGFYMVYDIYTGEVLKVSCSMHQLLALLLDENMIKKGNYCALSQKS
jgi:hypothetical protein